MVANIPIVQEYMDMPEQELVACHKMLRKLQEIRTGAYFEYIDGDKLNETMTKISAIEHVAKERGIELGG